MRFAPTDEQLLIQKAARDFAEREIAPKAMELDKTGRWPTEIVVRMAELGFLGMMVPGEYGGAGLDAISYVLAMEEVSAACASCGVIMSVNNSLFCDPVLAFGNEEQKRVYLVPAAAGKMLGCFGLTEPMSGSDAQTMKTVAEKSGAAWVMNGSKNFITNGPEADFIIVFAVTSRDAGKAKHTAFVFPLDAPGITLAPHDEKMGIHAAQSCTVFFENVKLGEEHVLGPVGSGFKVAMATLDGGRIGIASQAIGIARGALEAAVRYAGERRTFGQPIIQHQAIGAMLADAATWLDAATLMALRAAHLKEHRQAFSQQAAMAKLFATEHAWKICDIALQVHGGYGYVRDFPVERALRDVRVTRIYEGTSEIQRLVIARNLLR